MKISDLTQKPRWERRAENSSISGPMLSNMNPEQPMEFTEYPRYLYTQDDFEAEKNPSSHLVYNIKYRSNRPLYVYDEKRGKNIQDGYDKVERVAVAFQKSILRHKTTHCFGNAMRFSNEGNPDDTELVNKFKSYWKSVGMKDAMISWGRSCFGTGDGAICLYKNADGKLGYKVFSFDKGDLITEFMNPEDRGKRNVVRKYRNHGIVTVEIYKSTVVETWVQEQVSDSSKLKKWFSTMTKTRSEDGYILQSSKPHGLTECPVIYHREPDVCWGDVQGNIEDIEKLLSDLLENGKYYNYQMLFVTGIVGGLPNINYQGKVIAGKTKDADAKILAPADASNTFQLSLDNSFKLLCDSVGAVFIRPGELKSGDYSGAYLRNLYFPETQWCIEAYARFAPALGLLMDIFKQYVGIVEGDATRYASVRMSRELTPFIPANLTEEAAIVNSSFAAGSISRQTAAEENPIGSADEENRLETDETRKTEMERQKKEQELSDANKQQQLNAEYNITPPATKPLDGRFKEGK